MEIRPATAGDYPAFCGLFPELGVPDPVPSLEAWRVDVAPNAIVVERDGKVVGYVYARVLGGTSHVHNLVVEPAARRAGVGEALMRAMAVRLRADGATAWELNVKVENAPAIRLYERLGMMRLYGSTVLRLAWADVAQLPGEPGTPAASLVDPSEDGEIEARFAVTPGLLASLRARGGRALVQLREAGAPVGLAAFNAAIPGAFPFAVARPGLAAALLGGIRPHANPDDEVVGLIVQDDAALVAALRAAGAEVTMELLRLGGPLPG